MNCSSNGAHNIHVLNTTQAPDCRQSGELMQSQNASQSYNLSICLSYNQSVSHATSHSVSLSVHFL